MAGSVNSNFQSSQWSNLPKDTQVDLSEKSDAERLDDLLKEPFKWVDLSYLELSFDVFSQWFAKVAQSKEDGAQIIVSRDLINSNLMKFDSLVERIHNMRVVIDTHPYGCYEVHLKPIKWMQRSAAVTA